MSAPAAPFAIMLQPGPWRGWRACRTQARRSHQMRLHACRSPLAGGGVIAVLKTVARAFGGLWRNTSDLSSEEVRART